MSRKRARHNGACALPAVDGITGVPMPSALLIIDNASNSFADYAKPASMQLTCFEGKPMVRFAF